MIYLCQCPRRAILISTAYEVVDEAIEKGVNALGGLFSFLPPCSTVGITPVQDCVNALGGLFSFLPKHEKKPSKKTAEVSMPSAGYSHFYPIAITTVLMTAMSVNALGGLFSFLLDKGESMGRIQASLSKEDRNWCVNALGGLFSFLRK